MSFHVERTMSREDFLRMFKDRTQQVMGLVYDHAEPSREDYEGKYDPVTGEYPRKPRPWHWLVERFRDYPAYGSDAAANFWLNPKGLAFGLGYTHHSPFLRTLGLPYLAVEKAGWIHVSDNRADVIRRPTAAQVRFLRNHAAIHGTNVEGLELPGLEQPVPFDTPFNVRPARG